MKFNNGISNYDVMKINCDNSRVCKMISEYRTLFEGIGKMEDVQIKPDINHAIPPKAQKHRRMPVHNRKKVGDELKRLQDAGVTEPVNEATGWFYPVVIENKSDGTIMRRSQQNNTTSSSCNSDNR